MAKTVQKRKRWSDLETQVLKRLLKEKRFKYQLGGVDSSGKPTSKASPLVAMDSTIWEQLSRAASASGVYRDRKQIRDKYRDELSPAIIPWRSPACWVKFNQLLPAHHGHINQWVAIHNAWIEAEGKAPSVRDLKNNWGKVKRAVDKGIVPKNMLAVWPHCQDLVRLARCAANANVCQQSSLESEAALSSSDDEIDSKPKMACAKQEGVSCSGTEQWDPLSVFALPEYLSAETSLCDILKVLAFHSEATATVQPGPKSAYDEASEDLLESFEREDALDGIWHESIPRYMEELLSGA